MGHQVSAKHECFCTTKQEWWLTTSPSKLSVEFVMNHHSYLVLQNIHALSLQFQNDFNVHANVWKEFFVAFPPCYALFDVRTKVWNMNEYDKLHNEMQILMEIKLVQILLVIILAFWLSDFSIVCKGETSDWIPVWLFWL